MSWQLLLMLSDRIRGFNFTCLHSSLCLQTSALLDSMPMRNFGDSLTTKSTLLCQPDQLYFFSPLSCLLMIVYFHHLKDSRGNINFVSDENSYDSLCQDDFKLYDILLTMPITLLCFKPDLSRMQATFRGYESGLEEDHFSLWNRRYRDYFFCWLRSFTFTDSELARMWTFNSNMDCATLYRSINRELDTFSNVGPLYRKFHMPVGESYWVDDFSNKDFNESEFLQKNTFFVRLCQQLLAARL